ncbi:Crp/Fnr family transcriptional regulator [Deferribacter autotrophicus]|uniref:Crp/Fnr family transcriptional regulator n=1 Tax=Deferribacter autotrophicus TaxID=500465 RepID=A0A5A8F7Q9_9BACT|nr:Crp/Fnr family transcriptional regulator [Deferribacter autotrophicus]KAA0257978.1 Crp/Fnr family transcriptional regulator [Deferribacter autotrophicus]
MNKKDALRFFKNVFLSTADDEIIEKLTYISSIKKISKKEILFMEEEKGSNVYFLVSGAIKLYKTNDEGKTVIIHLVKPGDIFAEILLYLKKTYPVTAEALEDSTVLAIDAEKLFDQLKANPDFSMKLIGALAKRIKELLSKIENLTLDDVKKRFLNYIYTLSKQKKTDTITLPAPKGDIALMLGIRAETFSRLLKKLQDEGIIFIDGKNIKILKEVN